MKKNRWIILILCAAFGCLNLMAQDKGIAFEPDGTTLEQAVAKAKRTRKMVFLDCYTSWCGPCKMMMNKVFPQEIVGNFMNPSYVSVKINMEKGYGAELGKKLQVTAYPTFVIFNADGQEVGRFLGGSQAEEFINRVKTNSVDKGSAEMDERFAAGERDPQFLMEYLNTLGAAYKRTQCNQVAEALLEGKEKTFAADSTLCMVFMKHINNPLSAAFSYTAKHPETLVEAIGERPVQYKLRNVWSTYPLSLIREEGGTVTMDEPKFEAYLKLMEECNVPERDHYRLNTLMTYVQKRADWPLYMKYLQEYESNPRLDLTDLELCKRATPLMACKDQTVRDAIITLLQQRVNDLESGKRQPQTKAGNMTLSGNLKDAMRKLIDGLKTGEVK